MMQYRGYIGVAEVDCDAGVIFGRVINTRDVITFQGQTVAEVKQAFQDSVEDYLSFCAERGEEPEKPFSGTFPVRTSPEIHRGLMIEAQREGVSLNQLVNRTLAAVVGRSHMTSGETKPRKGKRGNTVVRTTTPAAGMKSKKDDVPQVGTGQAPRKKPVTSE